jgi:hypothetical protein
VVFNYLSFDPFSESLFVSEDFDRDGDFARIFRIKSDGTVVQFGKSFNRPNGFSFPESGVMLVSEEQTLTVVDGWRNNFRRGDANTDGFVDISDSIFILAWIFLGDQPSTCWDAADIDDSAMIDISDAVYNLENLFMGGPPPPPPGRETCGFDPTIDLFGCRVYNNGECAITF